MQVCIPSCDGKPSSLKIRFTQETWGGVKISSNWGLAIQTLNKWRKFIHLFSHLTLSYLLLLTRSVKLDFLLNFCLYLNFPIYLFILLLIYIYLLIYYLFIYLFIYYLLVFFSLYSYLLYLSLNLSIFPSCLSSHLSIYLNSNYLSKF